MPAFLMWGEGKMNQFDVQYNALIRRIIQEGYWDKDQNVRTKWADGTPAYTKSVISAQIVIDGTQVPILTSKRVAYKTAIKEMLLFWQKKTNKVQDMHDMDVYIWDEWAKPDGTIGPAYGYQLGKKVRFDKDSTESCYPMEAYLDQVDYLIKELINNPSSRRHVTSLWNIDDLDEMALNPCVWHTQWLVKEKKLHLIVGQRSADVALGLPFNVFQYYVLQRMMAQATGYKMGSLTFNINDAHIYDRHIESLEAQIARPIYSLPTLWVNPDIKNFYDFRIEDFQLEGYEHGPTIKMEVAL